jgi:uncharacterized protein (DUF58 family)
VRTRVPWPTRRLALLIGAAAVLTVAAGGALTFVFGCALVILGAFVLDAITLSRGAPSASRTVPTTVALRVDAPSAVTVTPSGALVARGLRQPAPPDIVFTPDESGGGALIGTVRGEHRGRHVIPPVAWRAHGPIGLASADWTLLAPGTLTVIPDLPKARRLATARRGGGRDDGRIANRLGVGTEFETIRDYSPDDDIRQVNWVATSRCGRLMSNQYRVDENRDVVCVLDTGRLMASPVGDLTRLDVALDALTTLAVDAEESHDRVGALAFSSQVLRQMAPRRYSAESVVRALSDLEPAGVESDYERAFIAVGRHKRALVVLFTDLLDETASRALLEACSVLVRRHAVMVVTCTDVDLVAAASADPTDVHDVLRAAVALDLLAAKDVASARLRAMGVVVVESEPAQLGRACVRAYHRMKRRARL